MYLKILSSAGEIIVHAKKKYKAGNQGPREQGDEGPWTFDVVRMN
jgi:hypothetical protein